MKARRAREKVRSWQVLDVEWKSRWSPGEKAVATSECENEALSVDVMVCTYNDMLRLSGLFAELKRLSSSAPN